MKTLKAAVFFLVLAVSLGAQASPELRGTWTATTAENGALPGTLELRKDKTLVLRPAGNDTYRGTWEVLPPKILKLTVPEAGSSEMTYELKNNTLVLTYDNGNKQEFVRKKTKAKTPSK